MRQSPRLLLAVAVATVAALSSATPVRAQGFVSPLAGFDFSGDAACPRITNCTDKRLNAGVAIGVMGSVLGFEEEFAYARDFFGQAPGLSSSVLTLTTNVLLVPRVGPVRPYALAGVGLIKTHVSWTPSSLLPSDHNDFGWDVGGGVFILFTRHVGIRGDIRHFHAFQNLNLLLFTVSNPKLDFGRASVAFVITF
jgi:opacity protein-like surface antigen